MNSILLPDDFCKILPSDNKISETFFCFICGGGIADRSKTISLIIDYCKKSGILYESFYPFFSEALFCAVFLPQNNMIIADSDYFNKISSVYPSPLKKTVSLDNFTGCGLIVKNSDILAGNYENEKAFMHRYKKYKASAAEAKFAIESSFLKSIDREKVANYIIRFLAKNKISPTGKKVKISLRRASTLMPTGVHTDLSAFSVLEKMYVINDSHAMISELLISGLCFALNACGVNHTMFLCGLTNRPEHIVIPKLSVGFFTENDNHLYKGNNRVPLSIGRFLNGNEFISDKESVYFDVLNEFLDEAVLSLYEIAELEKQNTEILSSALDKSAYKQCADCVIKNIDEI